MDSKRCLVCGTQFEETTSKKAQKKAVQGSRMPTVTLSLPLAFVLFVFLVVIGGTIVYLGVQEDVIEPDPPTPVPTATMTVTPSATPTATLIPPTNTPQPTPTPQTYVVQSGDYCSDIAYLFGIDIRSLILANPVLTTDCFLSEGQELIIPYPTPTATPLASATPSNIEATRSACETVKYVIESGDSWDLIALYRNIPVDVLMEWNGRTNAAQIYEGETIEIPLCKVVIVNGSTVTPSPAPPYPAPSLLKPEDGSGFTSADEIVTLQWASVGTLRNNEFYQVTIIDISTSDEVKYVTEVKDNSLIVPDELRPSDNSPHIFRWYVITVARVGVDEQGEPIFSPGGAVSETWAFTWEGSGGQ